MNKIESDVSHERLLAKTLIELRETFTRARMLLPSLSLPEMLTIAGAMEQAKTEGMKHLGQALRTDTKALPARSKKAPSAFEIPGAIEDVPVLGNSLSVTIGKKEVHMVVAAARLLVNGPLTIREMLDAMEKKGWKINSDSEHVYQIVRGLLVRQSKYFKSTNDNGSVKFALKRLKAQSKPVRVRKEAKAELRAKVVKTLSATDGTITTAALAEKLGLPNGQGLVPLLVSMKNHGAIKKSVKNVDGEEVTLWTPNADKLQAYHSERSNGHVFNKGHVDALNGVSHG